MIIFTRWGICF